MPSYDFVFDCLEHMESQGFQYCLVLFDGKSKDEKKGNVKIFTTFDDDELRKIAGLISGENKKIKTEKHDRRK